MAKNKPDSAEPSGEEPSFEESVERLEEIVEQLEGGGIGLSKSLSQYEEGVAALRRCYQLLDAAEGRIEILTRFDDEGNAVTQPLDDTGESLEAKEAGGSRRRRVKKSSARKETAPEVDRDNDSPDIDATGSLF